MNCAQLIAWERRLASIERKIAWQQGYEAGRRSAEAAALARRVTEVISKQMGFGIKPSEDKP